MAEPPVGARLSIHDPAQVGPWQVLSRLGAGGMGVVYYATHEGQAAAVKVIRPGLLDLPSNRERFSREAGILESVRDVHISQFLACDLDSEPAWLAVEYLSGPVLRDAIELSGPLLEDDWWELAAGIAQALAVLEVHRITHRDLKPGNVILNQRGPVLIDFGIAHPEDATALTATGLVTGSPAWLSPEQANLNPTGPASDIFALGSLLAYAATSRPPFGSGASVAVLVAITTREPDLEGIDPIRMHLLRAMLAKSPKQRPTALEVLRLARARGAATAGTAERPAGPVATGTSAGASAPSLGDADDLPPSLAGQHTATGQVVPGGATAQASPHATSPATSPPSPPPPTSAATSSRSRVSRPRNDVAARRVRRRRQILSALLVVLVIVASWFTLRALGVFDGDRGPGIVDQIQAPDAPASDQLGDDDWFIDSYRLNNADGDLTIDARVRNRGDETSSADLRVWVYLSGEVLGSVSASVKDIAPGQSVAITMTGDARFETGPKVILLEAD